MTIKKIFLWCQVRYINPVKIDLERITQEDKELLNKLDYDGIEFSVRQKDFRLKQKTTFALMCFVMKTNWFFQIMFHVNNLKTRWICCM